MAARKLAATVLVHQEDGTVKAYGPGDDVPAADAKKIENPKAWASEDDGDSKSGK